MSLFKVEASRIISLSYSSCVLPFIPSSPVAIAVGCHLSMALPTVWTPYPVPSVSPSLSLFQEKEKNKIMRAYLGPISIVPDVKPLLGRFHERVSLDWFRHDMEIDDGYSRTTVQYRGTVWDMG